MEKNKKITIVGEFRFPAGDAASIRVLGIARVLKELGYEVSFIGKTWEKDKTIYRNGTYDDFKYVNVFVPNESYIKRFLRFFYSGIETSKLLKSEFQSSDLIIYYGSSARYLYPLLKYKKERKIKLLVDLVEWYDTSHLAGGRFGPLALDVNVGLKRLIPKCDGIIAISSYLQNHFSSKNVKSIRIPQIIDTKDPRWNLPDSGSFDDTSCNLVYAGVPGRKDLLSIAILGVHVLVKQGVRIKLHLFGPTVENVKGLLPENSTVIKDLSGNLIFHGKAPQDQIPSLISKADYSVLIRPNKRYANAGFATKFVESYAVGLPVIANITSDIGMYLKDSVNGFVIEECTLDSFIAAVTKAVKLTNEERKAMRIAAKQESLEFDYRNYIDVMENLLSEVNG